jgi:signal transduction histidine kinase
MALTEKITNIKLNVWKKINDKFRCYISNCGVKNNTNLDKYISSSDIDFADNYIKVIDLKEHQIITKEHIKIILEYINDETIIEIHIDMDDNLYLLSTISHKIRNPLNNIIGALTLLDDLKLTKEQKKYIGIVKDSSYDIVSVANDILDLINLSKDEIKLKFESTDIKKLLKEVGIIISSDTNSKSIVFKINVGKDVPNVTMSDAQRLKQIIISLLNNGIKHTENGHITLEVSLFNKDENDCPFTYVDTKESMYNILFKIKDTGSGMNENSKNFAEKMLGINKKELAGNYKYGGFGLLISKHLCNLMGGNIWFKTEKDIGTVFYFNIICDALRIGE